jgi:hypothetical protein
VHEKRLSAMSAQKKRILKPPLHILLYHGPVMHSSQLDNLHKNNSLALLTFPKESLQNGNTEASSPHYAAHSAVSWPNNADLTTRQFALHKNTSLALLPFPQ